MYSKNPFGCWIQTPSWEADDAGQARLVCFRKTITLSAQPDTFPVNITAAGRYKLYVNGCLVQYGPAKGDQHVWFYDRIELSPYLQKGENAIAALLLAYPLDGEKGNHSLLRFERPRLFLGLPAGYEEEHPDAAGLSRDNGQMMGRDCFFLDDWRCRIVRSVTFPPEETEFAPLQIHECAAGDPDLSGWKLPSYDDSSWDMARPCPDGSLPQILRPNQLCPRPIPFMERKPHAFHLPVEKIPAGSEQSFVLDAGEEMCAFLRLEISGGCGAEIRLLESEAYCLPDGKGDRTDSIHGHLEGYTDIYRPAGLQHECYEPFWFRTFRYLQISVKTGEAPLFIHSLSYEETGYPLEVKTSVTTSDQSHAPIWDMSLRTLRRCMHETYMDCPFYEQLQYAMDTRAEILYTYAISADDRLARQAIDDFRRAQRPDGLLNCSYPNVNTNVIPGFSIYYILMVHDHMMYFGDRELVKRNLPAIGNALNYFKTHLTPEGLVDKIGGVNGKAPFWSFIDWAELWMPTEGMPTAGLYGPVTMESLLYLMGLQAAAELCAWVSDQEADSHKAGTDSFRAQAESYKAGTDPFRAQAESYRQEAQALKSAIQKYCMDESGMLTDGPGRPELSQHCQVFGLLTGILTKEEGRRNLLRTMTEPGIAQCTVASSFYLFRALEQTGLYAYTDRYWDIWRRMLANHCTTCVEGEYYPRSECHAWGALALYELPSTVLGVRPAAPGYEKISINPQPGYLQHASGTVHTPKGDVEVSWHIEDGKLQSEVSYPTGVKLAEGQA